MTSLGIAAPPRSKRPPPALLMIAGIGLALLIAAGYAEPSLALHGWLIGFTYAANAPLGAVALLLIHALTGGRWGEVHRPALRGLARSTPALLILALPIILGAHAIYPWAVDPSAAGPDVARLYLNIPAIGLRSIIGLGALAWIARRFDRDRPRMLEAGLGLCVYALFTNAAAYDWLLSLAPRFTSSAFGVQVIVGQILAALSWTVLTSRARRDDPSWGDLGGLMLATLLGLSYLILMSLAINWYGDKPEQARWYMVRTGQGWVWIEAAGALIGATLPMLALLFEGVRRRPLLLRSAALCSLSGLFVEYVWLVAPDTEALSALTGLVATITITALLLAVSRTLEGPPDGA